MINETLLKCNDSIEEDKERCVHGMSELMDWIQTVQDRTHVELNRITLPECNPWFYDGTEIRNEKGSFFQITGIRQRRKDDGSIIGEHPIIIQDEIGFLGIMCCKIEGVWHYLMQAKIEPGNVNTVQISPTIQATKSNFQRKHGGKAPMFLDYFLEMKPENILVDQLQSEQSSRFLCKRNRNVILMTDEPVRETDYHRWMTLRQIKELMKIDNLINMDTRTVLSCIPYVLLGQEGDVPFKNKPYFYKTAWNMKRQTIVSLYKTMNDYKMFSDTDRELVPLHELKAWQMKEKAIECENSPFEVIYCDIDIGGREVQHWRQPLFAAKGSALFGLICCDSDGVLEFLVKPRAEIGCFDRIEIGPTLQMECNQKTMDDIERFFVTKMQDRSSVVVDTMLSEEGGRFYQEQNRNVILLLHKGELDTLPPGYVWTDYGTVNLMTQINNCLNIQLRNLLSLLEL